MAKVKRLVADVRRASERGKVPYIAWPTWLRNRVYGNTEAKVRSRLRKITWCGVPVSVHYKVADNLRYVQGDIRKWEADHGYEAWQPDTVECFNWQPIRGGSTLSRHAHAIAL